MNKFSVGLLAFLGIITVSCNSKTKQAIEYHDCIIIEHIAIQHKFDSLDASFENYNPDEMQAAWQDAKEQTELSKKAVEELGDFDGKNYFQKSALAFFELYNTVLNDYYSQMIDIYSIPDEEYTEADEARFAELNDSMRNIYFPAFEEFKAEQLKFADEYGFEVKVMK
jgi:hypothetical protein